ncbi:hypothetical protein DFJ77DRAFT_206704 [Powellomyces hirtus]|nr:hypothetical protein DFJ77DRAFT_206704 [Powellomyces hirtus]
MRHLFSNARQFLLHTFVFACFGHLVLAADFAHIFSIRDAQGKQARYPTDDEYVLFASDTYNFVLYMAGNSRTVNDQIELRWKQNGVLLSSTTVGTANYTLGGYYDVIFATTSFPPLTTWPMDVNLEIWLSRPPNVVPVELFSTAMTIIDTPAVFPSVEDTNPYLSLREAGTTDWVQGNPVAVEPGTSLDLFLGITAPKENGPRMNATYMVTGSEITTYPSGVKTPIAVSSWTAYPYGWKMSFAFPTDATRVMLKIIWGSLTLSMEVSRPDVGPPPLSWMPSYLGEPLGCPVSMKLSQIPVRSRNLRIDLISVAAPDTVAATNTAAYDPLTENNIHWLGLNVPATLWTGFYYLSVSVDGESASLWTSPYFRLNRAAPVHGKLSGVTAGTLTLGLNDVATWDYSQPQISTLFGDKSVGADILAHPMVVGPGMVGSNYYTALEAKRMGPMMYRAGDMQQFLSQIGPIHNIALEEGKALLCLLQAPLAGYGNSDLLTYRISVLETFNVREDMPLKLVKIFKNVHEPGSPVTFVLSYMVADKAISPLPVFESYKIAWDGGSKAITCETMKAEGKTASTTCVLPSAADISSAGPYWLAARTSANGAALDIVSQAKFLILPTTTEPMSFKAITSSVTINSAYAAIAFVIVNPQPAFMNDGGRFKLYSKPVSGEAYTWLVGTDWQSYSASAWNCIGITESDSNFQHGKGSYQLRCRIYISIDNAGQKWKLDKLEFDYRPAEIAWNDATFIKYNIPFDNVFIDRGTAILVAFPVAKPSLGPRNPANYTAMTGGVSRPQFFRGQAASVIWTDDYISPRVVHNGTTESVTIAPPGTPSAFSADVTITLQGLTQDVGYTVCSGASVYNSTADTNSCDFTVACGWKRGLYRMRAYYTGYPIDSLTLFEVESQAQLGRYHVDFQVPIEIVAQAPDSDLCAGKEAEGSAPSTPGESSYIIDEPGVTSEAAAVRRYATPMAVACALLALVHVSF